MTKEELQIKVKSLKEEINGILGNNEQERQSLLHKLIGHHINKTSLSDEDRTKGELNHIKQKELDKYKKQISDSKIDYYKNLGFNTRQSEILSKSDADNINVSSLENCANKYDNSQLSVLIGGLKHNLDISKFNNPNFSYETMVKIREELKKNKYLGDEEINLIILEH